jgi:hypothetical protein
MGHIITMTRLRPLKPICVLLPLAVLLAGFTVISPDLAEDARNFRRTAAHHVQEATRWIWQCCTSGCPTLFASPAQR